MRIPRLGPLLRGVLLACAAAVFSVPAICAPARPAAAPCVLAGTALLEDIVADLGGGTLTARTLIPGSACPGHADLRASDVAFSREAGLILIHDWQRDMPMLRALARTAPETQARTRVVPAPGNWMLPGRQAEATTAVAKLLSELAPGQAKGIQARAKARQTRIAATADRLRERAARAGLVGVRVACDGMQRPLLEWLGLVVVAEYGRMEGMTPRQMAEVAAKAKAGGARLVVDNLQSTGGSGRALAEDLGAGHAVLTNFPGVPGGETWEKAVAWNVERLAAAAGARR
jgi:zinc transport system substrate-binding protein